ncbi:hypothetical protein [Psychroserpens sp.]|uniref:hypothetical protein n=1 Tax=Psychroserpens sp. TaxID=2020870 RepID=UPI002B267285|nr:hypothetical protein [Psychroserpens sp.]
MKKNIIIFSTSLAIVSLLFLCFTNWNSSKIEASKLSENKNLALDQNVKTENKKDIPDLYYGVDTRFAAIKKSVVDKATTIYDFLNDGEKQQIEHIHSVKLVMIQDNQLSNIRALGTNDQLTVEQLKILKSTGYFSHFTIRTEFKGKNKDTGQLEDRFFGPHITVVPDKQAAYKDGNDVLINYLKDNSLESMNAINGNDLGAIKISFMVTKEGKVSNVKHDAMTTGYSSIDEKLMDLVKNIPGEWTPAENSNGEKMDYEFVFTFGPRDGC